jgi:hypothetical protein
VLLCEAAVMRRVVRHRPGTSCCGVTSQDLGLRRLGLDLGRLGLGLGLGSCSADT